VKKERGKSLQTPPNHERKPHSLAKKMLDEFFREIGQQLGG
jgi:hypothetical protein